VHIPSAGSIRITSRERGVPLAQVRDLLGHASITTTERYDNQKLEFTSSGLEALVRYPVALRQSLEIDERITRAILNDSDLTHEGTPAIRLKTAT
jgi:hypothetical protein